MASELDSGLPLLVTLKPTRITLGITAEEVKGTDSVDHTYIRWKMIPGFGSCNSKWPGAKVCDSWADDEVAASGRSQLWQLRIRKINKRKETHVAKHKNQRNRSIIGTCVATMKRSLTQRQYRRVSRQRFRHCRLSRLYQQTNKYSIHRLAAAAAMNSFSINNTTHIPN